MGSVRNSQESRPGEINLFDTPYNVTDISEQPQIPSLENTDKVSVKKQVQTSSHHHHDEQHDHEHKDSSHQHEHKESSPRDDGSDSEQVEESKELSISSSEDQAVGSTPADTNSKDVESGKPSARIAKQTSSNLGVSH